jgi:hypothetical protein
MIVLHCMLDVPSLRNKRPSARSISSLSLTKQEDMVISSESLNSSQTGISHLYEPHQIQQINILGSGTGGWVTKVLHIPTNTILACKVLKSIDDDDDGMGDVRIQRELEIHMCKYSQNVWVF